MQYMQKFPLKFKVFSTFSVFSWLAKMPINTLMNILQTLAEMLPRQIIQTFKSEKIGNPLQKRQIKQKCKIDARG